MNTKNQQFLESRGWHTWYRDDYWVNPKCVSNPKAQDYTNYGMTADEATRYELSGGQPAEPRPDVVGILKGLK